MVNCSSFFISSTYKDLKRARQLVYEAMLQCKCLPIGMEYCENTEDILGYGNERIISGDLMRIKMVLVAHHLIVIDSFYRWEIKENL